MSDILKRQNDVDARARLDQSGERLQEGKKKPKEESAPEKKRGGIKAMDDGHLFLFGPIHPPPSGDND